ncbi:MAG TPA: DUF4157 domain-containing protein, partial [Polyangia bacterium]|nr:DUF4157 domain-containing protein [Polyangia bacterium]
MKAPREREETLSMPTGPAVQAAGGNPNLSDHEITAQAEQGIAGASSEVPYREKMEVAFGVSFADVRAHTDDSAAAANRGIGATAYTVGERIAFAHSNPPESLVAHELAHVVQQRAGIGPTGGVGRTGDAFEREADRAAAEVVGGGKTDLASRYPMQGAQAALQRKSVQRYESGEHAMLGCGAQYPFVAGAEVTLPNGARVYPGEMVAFPDFYADLQQLTEAPRQEVEALVGFCRLEALWFQARRLTQKAKGHPESSNAPGSSKATPAPPKGHHSAGVTAIDGDHDRLTVFAEADELKPDSKVWQTPVPGGHKLGDFRDRLIQRFTPAWQFFGITFAHDQPPPGNVVAMKATIGRRRFRGANDSLFDPKRAGSATQDPAHLGGDYLDLASNNVSHFTPDSWETWKAHHEKACQLHHQAQRTEDKALALVMDQMGCHFLTDRFSAGHTVNKEELMQYATTMMLRTAGAAHPEAREGEATDALLRSTLEKALTACFHDSKVADKWDEGVDRAFQRNLIARGERDLLKDLPKYRGPNTATIVGQVTGVIMDMPWRNVGGTIQLSGDSRSYGPASQTKGKGGYHLGAGNLAALQVHNALNAIGFTVRNRHGQTWRMQGDEHLTTETQKIAQAAVSASRRQVQ